MLRVNHAAVASARSATEEDADASPIARSVPGTATPSPTGRWLDLFYDLVFVAAILILSSRVLARGATTSEAFWFGAAFVSIWWIWLATTLHANRFPADDVVYRILMLTQMFLVALVAIGGERRGARASRVRLRSATAC